jgi:hypothetical protein
VLFAVVAHECRWVRGREWVGRAQVDESWRGLCSSAKPAKLRALNKIEVPSERYVLESHIMHWLKFYIQVHISRRRTAGAREHVNECGLSINRENPELQSGFKRSGSLHASTMRERIGSPALTNSSLVYRLTRELFYVTAGGRRHIRQEALLQHSLLPMSRNCRQSPHRCLAEYNLHPAVYLPSCVYG